MAKHGDTDGHPVEKAKATSPKMENRRLTAQIRKILGKHYANKYRSGRG